MGFVITIISAVCYGCNPLFSSVGTNLGFPVLLQVAIRFLGTAAFLLCVVVVRKKTLAVRRKTLSEILAMGALTFGLTSVLLYESYRFAPSGMDTSIHFLYPVFVMLLSWLSGQEKLCRKLLWAILLAVSSLFCIIQPWTVGGAKREGVLLALASSVTFSLYVVFLGRKEIREVDNTVLVFLLSLSAGVVLFVLCGILGQIHPDTLTGTFRSRLLYIIFQPLVTSVTASTFFALGARMIGGTRASIVSMFEPATAVIIGFLFLGERLNILFFVGFGLLLCAVYLTVSAKRS